ncbi:hypothetical protein [Shewanella baltica]|uniref:hypothetical protein n=1 Tax=Shewanella baltica TaxID=62322 RepID=UPI00217CDFF1|nr:hypothetical protein [Shewanella baltica]MCS6101384.1 hypothetical protein [Shewanella baltica]MCS6184472.1 hypothetical protein [Shewanella baltica]
MMKQLATKPAPTALPLHAANEHHGEAGQAAIAAIRSMLGKSSAASQYDKLNQQQRAMILFAARLRPAKYINLPLLSLTLEEREAIRVAIIALLDLGKAFGCVPLSRDQFFPPRALKPVARNQAAPIEREVNSDVDNTLAEINRLAASLSADINEIEKH